MTIEKRNSRTAHGIPSWDPKKTKSDLEEVIYLNQDGKSNFWPDRVTQILDDHIPVDMKHFEIPSIVSYVTGLESWGAVVEFVQEDMCLEFFNMALAYCLREGQVHQEEKDFIDGSGIGYVRFYTDRLKVTLEKCFDAKYYYNRPRPLEYLRDTLKLDLTPTANYIHPGHPSYPAGHGTKFLTAVEVLNDIFHLDKDCYRQLFIAACVCAHGRSGNLIHYLADNLAGGHLTKLKEFQT